MTETWVAVPGWDRLYEVSSLGQVRSVPRVVPGGNGSSALRGGCILKASNTGRYLVVSLSNGARRQTARIHVLVATAFLGPRPDGMNACHNDGNSLNNAASNLRWATQTDNIHDKIRHGTDRFALKRGACRHGHLFTPENTYLDSHGSPTCRTCRRDGMRNRKAAA